LPPIARNKAAKMAAIVGWTLENCLQGHAQAARHPI
jgi:hypothetical protein